MEFVKKNFAIILAFALPVILIAGVALSTYLPSLFLSTNYNFIYTSCEDNGNYNYYYNCNSYLEQRYSVINGSLFVNTVDPSMDTDRDGVPDMNESFTARIFLHDTEKNESREITQDEAKLLKLNNLLTSPDGVSFSSHYDRGADFFFIFGGSSSNYGYYLTKGNSRSRINLINSSDRYYYQNNFKFIGWVLPGRS